MRIKRSAYTLALLVLTITASAQVNIYLGGNLQGNYSWVRGDEHTFKPGFGGGFSFVYWEYEYWFIKAGLDYIYKSSSCLHFPEEYDVPIESPDDRISITYTEQAAGVPLTVYFRPWESGFNTLLVTGTLEMMFVAHLKENSAEFGEIVIAGNEIKTRTKTSLGIGVGYQRQLDRHIFLNIVPSFNLDLRASRPYNSFNLTAEVLFGVY